MTEYTDQTVSGDVTLDGGRFVNCQFSDAVLTYAGGKPPHIENCGFDRARFVFVGPAAQTLVFMRSMAPESTNMRFILDGLIPELKA